MTAVVITPLAILAAALGWVSYKGEVYWLDLAAMVIFWSLTLDVVRRGRVGGDTSLASCDSGVSAGGGESGELGAPYLLIRAGEHDLLRLEAESSLRELVERTPIRGLRVAAATAVDEIANILPDAEIVPWTAGLNEAVMEEYERVAELSREKIADAMAADSSKLATEMENADLRKKVGEALEANRKYEAVLQDLRSRPINSQVDYSKMTPSQRSEEEKRLRENLTKLQDMAKAGRLEPISIPSHFRQIGKL